MILLLIFIVFVVMLLLPKGKDPITPKCPHCNGPSHELGPATHLAKGGYLATAGKQFLCKNCGATF